MNHDIVCIGGSAGALDVLLEVVGELPRGLPATVFLVIHTAPSRENLIPELLGKRGPLPASQPLHGEKFERSHIYVAPSDTQMLVRQGTVEVVRGPRENGQRPSVDALFRTASQAYGPRVIGVVLSGYLDCGTAGMMSVKARGGISVVQSLESAVARDMPARVIERVKCDHVVDPLELRGLLVRLVQTPAGREHEPDRDMKRIEGNGAGDPAELVCPTCQGVITEAQAGALMQFRCHVGHAFTLESLVREQSEEMERALWAAVRSLEESAALSDRLGGHDTNGLGHRFDEKARTQRSQADVIRHILLHGNMLTPADEPKPQ